MPDIENLNIFKSRYDKDTIDEALGRALSNVYMEKAVEGYFHDGQFYADEAHTELIPPREGVLYMDISYDPAFGYRWGGSQYCGVTTSEIFITEAARQAAEDLRVAAENARAEAEQRRVLEENARNVYADYSPDISYQRGNKVVHEGACYVCLVDCMGKDPQTYYDYWLCIAERGASGDGSGDMVQSVYDPQSKRRDVFAYTDGAVAPFEKALVLKSEFGKFKTYNYKLSGTNRYQIDSMDCQGFEYGNGRFQAVGRWNNPYAASQISRDGMDWEKDGTASNLGGNMGGLGCLMRGADRFVCFSAKRPFVWLDTGTGWTNTIYDGGRTINAQNVSSAQGYGYDAHCWTGTRYLFASGITAGSTYAAYSTNGLEWTQTAMPVSKGWRGMACGEVNGVKTVVAVSMDGYTAYSTDDGETWTEGGRISGKYFYACCYVPVGNGRFITGGSAANLWYTDDGGVTWAQVNVPWTSPYIKGICWAFNKLYTSTSGAIWYSTDGGLTWTAINGTSTYYYMAYGAGRLVFASYNQTAYTTNGTTIIKGGGAAIVNKNGELQNTEVLDALGAAVVQVETYVGLGTYGPDNPCSFNADRPIKAIVCLSPGATNVFMDSTTPTSYTQGRGLSQGGTVYGKKSSDGKTFSWYADSAAAQLNTSGVTYRFLIIK